MSTHHLQTDAVDLPEPSAEEVPEPGPDEAAERIAELLDPERIDALLADAQTLGLSIDGPDGLINQMIKAVLERGLEAELTDHLGYERGDPAGAGSGNSRNGFGEKTVITSAGQARIEVPREIGRAS